MSSPDPFDRTARFVPRSRSGLGQFVETLLSGREIRERADNRREAFALDQALAQARADRAAAEANIARSTDTNRGQIRDRLIASGVDPVEADLQAALILAGGGSDFSAVQQGLGRQQERTFRQKEQEAFARGEIGLGNSFALALDPTARPNVLVQGGQVITDPFSDSPSVTPTLGERAKTAASQALIPKREAETDAAIALAEQRRRENGDSASSGLTVQQALSIQDTFSQTRESKLSETQRLLLDAANKVLARAAGLSGGAGNQVATQGQAGTPRRLRFNPATGDFE